ncbi:hypothetical protein Rs2_20838 [Raphanus sativus]|nr:hypothetical protein Rs2_20838 [Raphanus sativus]
MITLSKLLFPNLSNLSLQTLSICSDTWRHRRLAGARLLHRQRVISPCSYCASYFSRRGGGSSLPVHPRFHGCLCCLVSATSASFEELSSIAVFSSSLVVALSLKIRSHVWHNI